MRHQSVGIRTRQLAPIALAVAVALGAAGCDGRAPEPRGAPSPTRPSAAPSEPEPLSFHLRFRPAAYDGWLDDIPASVRVDVGLTSSRPERIRKSFCGHAAFASADPPVVTSRRATSGSDARDLRLFTDDRSAHRFMRRSLTVVAECPEGHRVHTSGHGDESATIWEADDRWNLTRIGNAVLITTGADHRAEFVRSMCVFAPQGCPVRDADIPVGFPLTAGLPRTGAEGPGAGLAGPSRALPPPTWTLCGRVLTLPEHRDRTTAKWSNPEDYRGRDLVTFDDEGSAAAFVTSLADFYRSCPRVPTGTDFIGYQHVEPRAVGDEAVALYRVQEYQGAPGLGVEITQAVRVGRAVLLDTVSNEGDARGVPTQLRRMTRVSAPVVRAMCAYADAGCVPAGALTLGPDGVGGLELGMSAAQVRAAGARVVPSRNGTGCSAFTAVVHDHHVHGDLDPGLGVSMLTGPGLVTPEGVTVGTVRRLAWAAYDDGGRDHQLFVPSVPGRSHRIYRMELFHRRVASLMLLADDQHCAS